MGLPRDGDGDWGDLAVPVSILINLNPGEVVGSGEDRPFESERVVHCFVPYDKVFVKVSVSLPFHDGRDLWDDLVPFVVSDPL